MEELVKLATSMASWLSWKETCDKIGEDELKQRVEAGAILYRRNPEDKRLPTGSEGGGGGAKPAPKKKANEWETASQVTEKTTKDELKEKANMFVQDLAKEYGTLQRLKLQVNGSSIAKRAKYSKYLKSLTKQCAALERLRASLDAMKKAKLEEAKPGLIEAASTLQASKKLNVDVTAALKKA
ncbi:unnamed protein product [Symbiodinium sp. CCMP2456]|nr:unnamed protein product [Symbiodinium sp. CCMP2456]